LWDIARVERVTGLDRRALIAAAFLVGSDYDRRGSAISTAPPGASGGAPSQRPPGAAVNSGGALASAGAVGDLPGLGRGWGPRRALAAVRALLASGGKDALRGLQDLLARRGVPSTASAFAAVLDGEKEGTLLCGGAATGKATGKGSGKAKAKAIGPFNN